MALVAPAGSPAVSAARIRLIQASAALDQSSLRTSGTRGGGLWGGRKLRGLVCWEAAARWLWRGACVGGREACGVLRVLRERCGSLCCWGVAGNKGAW